jgi:predicted aspartyl protease
MGRINGVASVDVSINGSGPYRFAIDWGANLFAISPRLAQALKLPRTGKDEMGNENVRVETLSLGGARFLGLTAAVDPFFDDKQEQGVLGVNVYADLLMTLDYPRKLVVFERGSLPPADGQTMFACDGGDDPEPTVEIMLGEKKIRAILDTGASRFLMLPERLSGELPLKAAPVAAGVATGPQSGTLRPREARFAGMLRLGAISVRDPLLTFHPRPRAFLGSAFLEHFAVTLDQKGKRVRFATLSPMPIIVPKAAWE